MLQPPHKTVILSEAPRRSIAYQRAYSAKSKDLGDASRQMLFGAFWPQTPRENKSVTSSERSAPHICRITEGFTARSRRACPEPPKKPRQCLLADAFRSFLTIGGLLK